MVLLCHVSFTSDQQSSQWTSSLAYVKVQHMLSMQHKPVFTIIGFKRTVTQSYKITLVARRSIKYDYVVKLLWDVSLWICSLSIPKTQTVDANGPAYYTNWPLFPASSISGCGTGTWTCYIHKTHYNILNLYHLWTIHLDWQDLFNIYTRLSSKQTIMRKLFQDSI